MKINRLRKRKLNCTDRLKRLAMEFATASAQVLRDDYGFTQEQANDFLAKVHAQAQRSRDALETTSTVEEIEKALAVRGEK